MRVAELRRWLKKQGCTFREGKRHTRVFLGDRQSTIPRHPAEEIRTRTLESILRDLGLKR